MSDLTERLRANAEAFPHRIKTARLEWEAADALDTKDTRIAILEAGMRSAMEDMGTSSLGYHRLSAALEATDD